MSALSEAITEFEENEDLSPEDRLENVWDVVNFFQSLSLPEEMSIKSLNRDVEGIEDLVDRGSKGNFVELNYRISWKNSDSLLIIESSDYLIDEYGLVIDAETKFNIDDSDQNYTGMVEKDGYLVHDILRKQIDSEVLIDEGHLICQFGVEKNAMSMYVKAYIVTLLTTISDMGSN